MSLRTFQRRFEEATGLPPGEWLIAERVRLAQEHLETQSARAARRYRGHLRLRLAGDDAPSFPPPDGNDASGLSGAIFTRAIAA